MITFLCLVATAHTFPLSAIFGENLGTEEHGAGHSDKNAHTGKIFADATHLSTHALKRRGFLRANSLRDKNNVDVNADSLLATRQAYGLKKEGEPEPAINLEAIDMRQDNIKAAQATNLEAIDMRQDNIQPAQATNLEAIDMRQDNIKAAQATTEDLASNKLLPVLARILKPDLNPNDPQVLRDLSIIFLAPQEDVDDDERQRLCKEYGIKCRTTPQAGDTGVKSHVHFKRLFHPAGHLYDDRSITEHIEKIQELATNSSAQAKEAQAGVQHLMRGIKEISAVDKISAERQIEMDKLNAKRLANSRNMVIHVMVLAVKTHLVETEMLPGLFKDMVCSGIVPDRKTCTLATGSGLCNERDCFHSVELARQHLGAPPSSTEWLSVPELSSTASTASIALPVSTVLKRVAGGVDIVEDEQSKRARYATGDDEVERVAAQFREKYGPEAQKRFIEQEAQLSEFTRTAKEKEFAARVNDRLQKWGSRHEQLIEKEIDEKAELEVKSIVERILRMQAGWQGPESVKEAIKWKRKASQQHPDTKEFDQRVFRLLRDLQSHPEKMPEFVKNGAASLKRS